MPLRQTDRRKSEEPEDCGWEQQPATREENRHYRVSGLVQLRLAGISHADRLRTVLIAQDKLRVEHYVRQDRQWVLSEADDRNDTIHLSSIGCRLALCDIYDKVNFPQEDAAAAAAVLGTPMVNAPDRRGA